MKTSRIFPSNFPSLFDQRVESREKVSSSPLFSVGLGDQVLVSAVKGGRVMATIALSGFSELTELLRAATEALKYIGGMVTLRLRNRTQGTTANRVVMLSHREMPMPFRVADVAVCTAS